MLTSKIRDEGKDYRASILYSMGHFSIYCNNFLKQSLLIFISDYKSPIMYTFSSLYMNMNREYIL